MTEPIRCGRPTKSGQPCRTILRLGVAEFVCHSHATENDRAIMAMLNREWTDAYRDAFEHGKASARWEYEAAAREAARAERFRLTDGGRQVVRFGKYAYTWNGPEPLRIGDLCRLPGNWLFKHPQEEVVTGFGTDYDGALQPVLCLLKRAETVPDADG